MEKSFSGKTIFLPIEHTLKQERNKQITKNFEQNCRSDEQHYKSVESLYSSEAGKAEKSTAHFIRQVTV